MDPLDWALYSASQHKSASEWSWYTDLIRKEGNTNAWAQARLEMLQGPTIPKYFKIGNLSYPILHFFCIKSMSFSYQWRAPAVSGIRGKDKICCSRYRTCFNMLEWMIPLEKIKKKKKKLKWMIWMRSIKDITDSSTYEKWYRHPSIVSFLCLSLGDQ